LKPEYKIKKMFMLAKTIAANTYLFDATDMYLSAAK